MFNTIARARRSDEGFTLIELLIVIVVLGILSAIVLFAVGSARDDSVASSCKAEKKTIETAQEAYKANNPGGYATATAAGVNNTFGALVPSLLREAPTKFTMTGGGATYTLTPVAPCTVANSD